MPQTKLENVSVDLKANVYFDGKVVSHSVYEKNGDKKTLGLIYPGSYSFNTGKPELMVITAGNCRVKQAGEKEWKAYQAGQEFRVPGNSSFEIAVENGIAEYLCVFE
ncbi:MAG: pyrimidine/purine nucleoside phosphorylase [bacterium]